MNELRKSVSKALILLDAGKISSLVARDQIFAAFKAHIEGCEPENPFFDAHANYCCDTGMLEMKKAILESLE